MWLRKLPSPATSATSTARRSCCRVPLQTSKGSWDEVFKVKISFWASDRNARRMSLAHGAQALYAMASEVGNRWVGLSPVTQRETVSQRQNSHEKRKRRRDQEIDINVWIKQGSLASFIWLSSLQHHPDNRPPLLCCRTSIARLVSKLHWNVLLPFPTWVCPVSNQIWGGNIQTFAQTPSCNFSLHCSWDSHVSVLFAFKVSWHAKPHQHANILWFQAKIRFHGFQNKHGHRSRVFRIWSKRPISHVQKLFSLSGCRVWPQFHSFWVVCSSDKVPIDLVPAGPCSQHMQQQWVPWHPSLRKPKVKESDPHDCFYLVPSKFPL